jgi:hypothetical protein
VGDHLRAVAAPQIRRGATAGDQTLQDFDGPLGVDVAADQHHQRFAGELVDHVEQLDHRPSAVWSN